MQPVLHDEILDLGRLRAETPGCGAQIHLNNAGAGLMPVGVASTVIDQIRLESEIGGYEAAERRRDAIAATYDSIAALVGTDARNIALTEHATTSIAQALSAIPFQRGDKILTTRHDYVSNQIMYLSLGTRFGVETLWIEDALEGGVDVAAFREAVQKERPRLVSVTHTPTNSGLIQDVIGIGRICREFELLYLVDACQSVGQLPIDVKKIGCDFLAATGRKFLRGPRGSGFLYVSDRALELGLHPLLPDLRGAEWTEPATFQVDAGARRFETWEFAYGLVLGLGAAAEYAMRLSLATIRKRCSFLANLLRDSLSEIPGVRLLERGPTLSAIVAVHVEGLDPGELVEQLRRRGINTWMIRRRSAVIDMDAHGIRGALRVSPHYYNTVGEIEDFIEALKEIATPA